MKYFFVILALFLFVRIYFPWFTFTKTVSNGDWPYLYFENIKETGIFEPPYLWVDPYYRATAKLGVEVFGIPWETAEKLFWFYPFIILSFLSSFFFVRWVLKSNFGENSNTLLPLLGSLIFTTNTYALMIVGGGQMGVAIAYAIAPFVLVTFIKLIDNFVFVSKNLEFKILNLKLFGAGLVLAAQVMFDPRVAIVSMTAVVIYAMLNIKRNQFTIYHLPFIIFAIPLGIAVLLNLFWIIPNFGFYQTEYSKIWAGPDVRFLSFASFSNAISLLHPNWPENIFGKVYFMRPEFLVLPLLAYSSLLFLNSKLKSQKSKLQFKNQKFNSNETIRQLSNIKIIFFALLGLVGAFLAKGANEPFGEVYVWLFNTIPGFQLFRDPTKFYVLVALSYSVLIPFSLSSFLMWVNEKLKVKNEKLPASQKLQRGEQFKIQSFLPSSFFIFYFLYFIFLIRPGVLGELSGTFKPKQVPQQYLELKDFLKSESENFSILWVPKRPRFGFYQEEKPAIAAEDIFGTLLSGSLTGELKKKSAKGILVEEGVRYVVVPQDLEKEIFLRGRDYDPNLRADVLKTLGQLSWLVKIKTLDSIAVYKIIEE